MLDMRVVALVMALCAFVSAPRFPSVPAGEWLVATVFRILF